MTKNLQSKSSRRKFLAILGFGCLGTAGYGRFFEPEWLRIRQHEVAVTKRSRGSSVKLLHLSDFHASPVVSLSFIEKAIRHGLEQKPDLICLTGDFITLGYEKVNGYAKILSSLSKHAPVFACLGNHDGGLWASGRGGHRNTEFVRDLLKQAGISLLHNSAQPIQLRDWRITLAGLGDSWAEEMMPEIAFTSLPAEPSDAVLALSHNPDTKQMLKAYEWDLLLCGHTHGGQLRLPLIGAPFAPVRDKKYVEGLHRWNERWIHITRGVGSLFGLRVNCRPEISLLTLV
jgi:predicted MPP superfamily phosphohydrolase